ncbi:hypothetical protein [Streptomyces sp. BE303]|uniref:Orn/Lys/Arg family decarboxylase n=1 Tax=Streptomyces sp. BE303 TaxID=3002528 RepID=UPI002E773088|nr:hypothetical protein [Streptomyces sp. BE303]MED7952078.1 hypothetical protein [Streptomyces sp. BE303]
MLSPALSFRPVPGDEVVDRAVAADLRRAYYTTLDAVVCVTSDGDEVWRSAFGPPSDRRFGHWSGCALSADGRAVWVYRPDVMAGRDRPDQWVVLDAGTGALVARADLSTVGQGGRQLSHRTSGQVLLNVGEGQDGSVVYRGSLTEGRMDLVRYPWDDRCLIDLSPDGRRFLTVHHDQTDLAVHTYPDGEVAFTLTVDAFGYDPDGTYLEWGGGYLDQDTVVVTLVGETEDEDELIDALDTAFRELPEPVVPPQHCYRQLIRGGTERLRLAEAAGRVAAAMVTVTPPGIPVLMPGEALGTPDGPVLRYLGALEAFDRSFPGFHSEAHGVSVDPGTGDYLIECVREDVRATW